MNRLGLSDNDPPPFKDLTPEIEGRYMSRVVNELIAATQIPEIHHKLVHQVVMGVYERARARGYFDVLNEVRGLLGAMVRDKKNRK
jgi:hypothetical protein